MFVICFIFILLESILSTLSSCNSSGYSPTHLILINALLTISLSHGFALPNNLPFGGLHCPESLRFFKKGLLDAYFMSCFIFKNCYLSPLFLKDNFSIAQMSAKETVPVYILLEIYENACLEWGTFM